MDGEELLQSAAPPALNLMGAHETSMHQQGEWRENQRGATPLVTIVITTRDRPELLKRAVASALAQTLGGLEVIVVDDGSVEPVQLAFMDKRLKLIRNVSPGGPCAARNIGLKAAKGRWITFLDDDDELLPHMLETSLDAARRCTLPAPVAVLSGIQVIGPSGEPRQTYLPVTLPKGRRYGLEKRIGGSWLAHNTLVVPTDLMREIGGWDERIRSRVSSELFLRLNAACSLQGVEVVTYRLHTHHGPRVRNDFLARAEGMKLMLTKHHEVFSLHPNRRAGYLRAIGAYYLKGGRWVPAISATTHGLLLNPRRLRAWLYWGASFAGPRLLLLLSRLRRRTLK